MSAVLVNPAKQALAAGGTVLAMTVRLMRTADAAMLAQAAGFDTIILDGEHGTLSAEAMGNICVAALALGMTPLVRVAGQSEQAICGALDGGALGVIVPHVDTAEEAARVAAFAHYPPAGRRSLSALGASTRYRALPLPELVRQRDAATLVIAMLETATAIANAEAIAAVPGIDGLLIGPNDLAADLGVADLKHPELRAAQAAAAAACRAHGKHFAVAILGADAAHARDLLGLGARFVMAGIDTGYLLAGARRDAEALRALLPK